MDHIGSWTTMVGYVPRENRAECYFQGIFSSATALASSFYTVVISLYLYLVTYRGSVLSNKAMMYVHAFCILFPIIVCTIPLAQRNIIYGNDDDEVTWCFIASDDDTGSKADIIWMVMGYYLWLFLAIFLMGFFLSLVGYHVCQMNMMDGPIVASLYKLGWYPVIFGVCWGLASFSDFYCRFKKDLICEYSVVYSTILSILQGFFCACVFFAQNKIVRNSWAKLLCGDTKISAENSKDFISTAMKVEDEVDYDSGGEEYEENDLRPSCEHTSNNSTSAQEGRSNSQILRKLSSMKKSDRFATNAAASNSSVPASPVFDAEAGEGTTKNPLSSSKSSSSSLHPGIILMDACNNKMFESSGHDEVQSYRL